MTDQISRRSLGALGLGAAAVAGAVATGADAQMRGGASLTAGNWMDQVKAQHAAIDAGFQEVKRLRTADGKRGAFRRLAGLLAAHSIAEETSLYPGIDMKVGDAQFRKASHDQQEAKVLTAQIDNALLLGDLTTATATLLTLEAAIKAHVAEEETQYYPALLRAADARMNAKMSMDFRNQFTKSIA